jgi:uncharacterized membrane protein YecN with MAPEG domain
MAIVHVVIALALIEFIAFSMLVGRARGKYKIEAPAMTGHPVFERYYRVHYNTLEQLVCFIPAMMMFGIYVSAPGAAVLGLVFILGRIVYFRGYIADPKKRGPGFMMSALPNLILLLGGLGGAIRAAL